MEKVTDGEGGINHRGTLADILVRSYWHKLAPRGVISGMASMMKYDCGTRSTKPSNHKQAKQYLTRISRHEKTTSINISIIVRKSLGLVLAVFNSSYWGVLPSSPYPLVGTVPNDGGNPTANDFELMHSRDNI